VRTPRSVSGQERAHFVRSRSALSAPLASARGKKEWEIERGVYTPIAMERVRKRLKGKGLRRPIAQKSPEIVDSKRVE
jgi:hypothetical protein